MSIEIQRAYGVPVSHGNSKYPWRDLQPGDSFVVDGVQPAGFRSGAYQAAIRNGIKVRVIQEGANRMRVVRIDGVSPSGQTDITFALPEHLRLRVQVAAQRAGRDPSGYLLDLIASALDAKAPRWRTRSSKTDDEDSHEPDGV